MTITIKEAKTIAADFHELVEFWFDRHLKLWAITDTRHAAASDWIASGHVKDMTAEQWRDYVRVCAELVAEYHGETFPCSYCGRDFGDEPFECTSDDCPGNELVPDFSRGPKHPVQFVYRKEIES